MQITQLFGHVSADLKKFKQESKEKFFSIKRHARRLKISACQTAHIEKLDSSNPTLNHSFDSKSTDTQLKHSNSELQSTFGDDNALSFKTKPLKRKTHLKTKIKNCQNLTILPQSNHQINCPLTKSTFLECEDSSKKLNQMPIIQQTISSKQFRISDFCILNKIGSGTYSEVYMAVEKISGFLCALKIMQKEKMKALKVEENVMNEIKIHSFLHHPNIAKLYGCFHDQEYIYLICQCATDQNLFQALKQPRYNNTKLSQKNQISKIVGQLCNSVQYIHKNSIIHRDIKPENILLTMYNTIKICDFGWSVYNPNNELLLTLCGTPLYLAPQLIAQSQYNQSVDIWAIGIITYELFTQQNPFKIHNLQDLKKILYEEIEFDKISNKFAIDFLQKALEKNPRKRQCISELAAHPFLTLY